MKAGNVKNRCLTRSGAPLTRSGAPTDEVFYENPTVPDNVITFINRYQTKGTGGLPLDSHGEHRNCEAGVGCENQKDLNPTGNEMTTKYPTPGSPDTGINHHTIIFEIADELVAKLK